MRCRRERFGDNLHGILQPLFQGCCMQPLKSFVRDVEDAIAAGEHHRRVETLRRLTTLFVEQSPGLNEEHVSVFDEVISRLAKEIEFRARVELAERLADVPNAPRRTVRDLAFDDNIEIARPVLERSTRLEENDLVSIARERGQGHLLALSVRDNLTEAVTDVLVVRGDQKVVRAITGNASARFSDSGFGTLVDRAAADPVLQAMLDNRSDLPSHHVEALMAVAKERVRHDLSSSGLSDGNLTDALDAGVDAMMRDNGKVILLADLDDAASIVDDLASRAILVEEEVVRLIKEDRVGAALACLGRIAGVPNAIVLNAYSAPHYDPLLFIVRGVRFSWGTFKLFIRVKLGMAPPRSLMRSAFTNFENLSVQTAQRVMRFVNAKARVAARSDPDDPADDPASGQRRSNVR
jgi:uncharacterized protein (DUF2336 family)